jgi:O-antigen/teichoic acid export membrane protein
LSLNYLLIPQWGIVGAAIASAATSACLNLLWLREVRRVSLSPSRRSYLSFLVPAALTMIVLVIVRFSVGSRLPDFLSVMLGLCTGYTAFVLSSLRFALEPHDRLLARSFYSRLRGSLTT